MTPRTKKFIGTIIMVIFVLFYILVVAGIAPRILNQQSKAVEMAFYVIAGLAWIVPLLPLVKWMEKRPE
jgi:MFS-type transporter involved in bile tolerance (Atg22 family)